MHIPDGFLPSSVYLTGYGITGAVTWYCLREIRRAAIPTEVEIPKASLLTAAFFVTSAISFPIPPISIHFVMNGLVGIILGYYSFLAILVGLFFQAVMFGHGGMASLGINAVIMGIPALIASYFFQKFNFLPMQVRAFIVGAGALALSATIFALVMINFIPADIDAQTERKAIYLALVGYGIQALLEGVFTTILVSFLVKVNPEMLVNNNEIKS
ncbi:cobalt transporter CbiM [Gloeocapsa sp. PCC 73106]|uniref:cobalt transporter CbiM n=1 Tax=Gloeocapsa sp. PCC 73106 TaxID=102232 RepID=UPI0002AD0984|nr:cobalt transporter CbiM [Gloeocapsa sp. PCC 73106]ELR97582.1 ABC-type Co2+ transport system, permease component [Gloeocapsa sp. PCC 73106]